MDAARRRAEALAAHVVPSPCAAAAPRFTVCVVGAAGGIGQPLALLLKRDPLVASLRLYDVAPLVKGVAADLSHINTSAAVSAYVGPAELGAALSGCDLVVIPAGVPRKPGMTRDDLFKTNAGIVKGVCEEVARACPRALVHVITNPVNSTVPIAAEVFKKAGTYDPARLMGVTMLDVMRARAFVGAAVGVPPEQVDVPVVGGHAGETILPLLSQTTPSFGFSAEEVGPLTTRIQNAGTEVVEAKAGAGSATLSMAAAAAEFASLSLRALAGEPGIVACAYVDSSVTALPFFACRCELGRNGVEAALPLGPLSPAERKGLETMLPELRDSIEKGVKFAQGK